jgi:hypothetical protein
MNDSRPYLNIPNPITLKRPDSFRIGIYILAFVILSLVLSFLIKRTIGIKINFYVLFLIIFVALQVILALIGNNPLAGILW